MSELKTGRPVVSVIMPIYNRAGLVGQALDSLCAQSYKSFEVIIVDDGSTDGTRGVLKRYEDKLDLILKRAGHTGNIAAVRNIGLSVAKGEYVAILDSDDVCNKIRLERQVGYFEENPDVDILASQVELFGEGDPEQASRLDWLYNKPIDVTEMIKRFMNDGCCLCHSSVMAKRRALEILNGYNEDFFVCEDYYMWTDAIAKGMRIDIMPEKLVKRRLHKDSVTSEYEGRPEAIINVVRIKLTFLIPTARLHEKKIAVLGVNKRNELIAKCLTLYFSQMLTLDYFDIHKGINPEALRKYEYFFVTTFSERQRAFDLLNGLGKQIVRDYVYL